MTDDLISRQAAIDAAKQHWYKPDIAKALEELPTIELRTKGAWIEVYDSSVGGHNSYTCSNCGLTIVTNPDYLKKHKFCFACGADMREENNG